MGQKTRHHTVPDAYLKFFSNSRKNGEYLFVFDKTDNKLFESEIANASVERNFYRMELAEQPLGWEDYYSKEVEPYYGTVVKQLVVKANLQVLNMNTTVFNTKLKRIISRLILHQLIRGREARAHMESFFDRHSSILKHKAYSKFQDYMTPSLRAQIDNIVDNTDIRKLAMAEASLNEARIRRMSALLLERVWILLKVKKNYEFVTSDNPVMFIDCRSMNSNAFSNGLLSSSTIVYYPLSHNLMLVLYPSSWKLFLRNPQDKIVLLNDCDTDFIKIINQKQIEQCSRQSFAKSREAIERFVKSKD